jgi:hypothetical protein
MNGLCMAGYNDNNVNLKYKYKVIIISKCAIYEVSFHLLFGIEQDRYFKSVPLRDEEMTIIPSISFPSKELSLGFKR